MFEAVRQKAQKRPLPCTVRDSRPQAIIEMLRALIVIHRL
jgi:hypothetical protein